MILKNFLNHNPESLRFFDNDIRNNKKIILDICKKKWLLLTLCKQKSEK